jgi:hypothetical protein
MQSQDDLNNEVEIMKMIGAMAATFPSIQIGAATVKAYTHLLKDVPLDVLAVAIEQCATESEFFPTVAKIRDKAISLTAPVRKDPMDAWGEVLAAISSVGFYNSPAFKDPLITKAVECLGWKYLCSSENMVADRAHFAKLYQQFVEREAQDRRLLPAARHMREIANGTIKEIGDGRGF